MTAGSARTVFHIEFNRFMYSGIVKTDLLRVPRVRETAKTNNNVQLDLLRDPSVRKIAKHFFHIDFTCFMYSDIVKMNLPVLALNPPQTNYTKNERGKRGKVLKTNLQLFEYCQKGYGRKGLM